MEYVGPEKRTIVGNVPLAIFLTLGASSLPWIAYALADWRLFSIITSAPIAVIVAAWWLVPESARWLVLKGKTDKTMETLRKCARINNKTVDPSIYEEFQVCITFSSPLYNLFMPVGVIYIISYHLFDFIIFRRLPRGLTSWKKTIPPIGLISSARQRCANASSSSR
jgi:hypothetical protein